MKPHIKWYSLHLIDTENSESESDYYSDEETDGEREDHRESKEGEDDDGEDEEKKGDKQLTYAYTERRFVTLNTRLTKKC